jgi:hypothetical protein
MAFDSLAAVEAFLDIRSTALERESLPLAA